MINLLYSFDLLKLILKNITIFQTRNTRNYLVMKEEMKHVECYVMRLIVAIIYVSFMGVSFGNIISIVLLFV